MSAKSKREVYEDNEALLFVTVDTYQQPGEDPEMAILRAQEDVVPVMDGCATQLVKLGFAKVKLVVDVNPREA